MIELTKGPASAVRAGLLAWAVMGCMGGSSNTSSGCTAVPPPRPDHYAEITVAGVYFDPITVGTTARTEVTVLNTGNTATTSFTIQALQPPFARTGGSCGSQVPAFGACTLVVDFSPTTTSQNSQRVSILYTPPPYANETGATYLSLQGRARPVDYAEITSSRTDYGEVPLGTTVTRTITITNSGNVATTSFWPSLLAPPFEYAGGKYPGTDGTCGAGLGAGASCSVVVTFAPTAAGPAAEWLAVDYGPPPFTDVTNPYTDLELFGHGVRPRPPLFADVGDSYAYFGRVPVGQTGTSPAYLMNLGNTATTSFVVDALPLPFGYAGGSYPGTNGNCGSNLAVGFSCTLVLTYSPTSAGATGVDVHMRYMPPPYTDVTQGEATLHLDGYSP